MTNNEFNPDWDATAVMVEEQQRMSKRIEELEAQLAQPEQEPVAWITVKETWFLPKIVLSETQKDGWKPVYTAPPQRESVYCGCGDEIVAGDGARCGTCVAVKYKEKEWQGLTDEELRNVSDDCAGVRDETEFIRAIEAKLKEKNNG